MSSSTPPPADGAARPAAKSAAESAAVQSAAPDPTPARAEPAALAERLKALADPARLGIVTFLRSPRADCCSRGDGVCACDLEGVLDLSQPTVSHHMKVLVEAGLVRADRRGRWVYYELDGAAMEALSEELRLLGHVAPALL